MSIYEKIEEFWDKADEIVPGHETKVLIDLFQILGSCVLIKDDNGDMLIPLEKIHNLRDLLLEKVEKRLPGFALEPSSPRSVAHLE